MRISSTLIALSTLLPFAASTYIHSNSCESNQFWWDDKECCLPNGGPPSPPQPPQGIHCPPSGYYWLQDKGCCAPTNPPQPNSPEPQCGQDHQWFKALYYCMPNPDPTPTTTTHKPSATPGKPLGGFRYGLGYGRVSGSGHESGKRHGYRSRGGNF